MCQVSGIRCQVYDDYGHHPTEIKATLEAFREKFPKNKIICVFQPHQSERLKLLFKEFKTAFGIADTAIIMPIYKVAGRETFIDSKYDSESLVKSMQKSEPRRLVFYLKEPKNLKKALTTLLTGKPDTLSPVIVMMGAGDIVKYTDTLLKVRKP